MESLHCVGALRLPNTGEPTSHRSWHASVRGTHPGPQQKDAGGRARAHADAVAVAPHMSSAQDIGRIDGRAKEAT
jgi:hypothetical protein